MIVFRLNKEKYIRDLSGRGAASIDGRWNKKDNAILYTSSTRALCILEILVHIPGSIIPTSYCMATLYIPDDLEVVEVEAASLPNNWKTNLSSTQSKGEEFLFSNKAPILKAPSAIVEDEYNFLINPLHKEASKVEIVEIKPFNFDDRLITS